MASQQLITAVKEYENYILANGIDEDAIDAFLTAAQVAILTEKDKGLGLKISKKTKKLIEILIKKLTGGTAAANKTVFVDFYITKASANVSELQIDAANFAGYYYVEASTLFRRQADGVDMPAEITLPNVKIQSNFTFSMASTGDPSTFTFTMDAMPGYTAFDKTKKVLCVMQVVEDADATSVEGASVMAHADTEDIKTSEDKDEDSVVAEQ